MLNRGNTPESLASAIAVAQSIRFVKQGNPLLGLRFTLRLFSPFLLGFDLDEPFAGQLLLRLGTALLFLGLDPLRLGVEFSPRFRIAALLGNLPLLLRANKPKVVPMMPASKAKSTRLAAIT